MSNRRNHTRKSTSDYFLLYEVGPNILMGRIMDLTTKGAMIMCETDIVTNVTVPCRLALPRMIGLVRNIFFEARIIWCRKHDKWDWYEAGLEIHNIEDDQLGIMEEIVAEWSEKSSSLPEISG
ncbi:MAG: PilZ domain-containing protein [bacterium]|nr:PilZ domain-containing protein [bacterium]